jgi:hypothetical protein
MFSIDCGSRLAQHPKCKIIHSLDPSESCGIGFLSFAPGVDGNKMREALWSKHNILDHFHRQ